MLNLSASTAQGLVADLALEGVTELWHRVRGDLLDGFATGSRKVYTVEQLKKFAKEHGIITTMSHEEIFEFCAGRQDLAESLILSIPESYGDEALSLVQRAQKYHLPQNPSNRSLSSYQTRIWYKWQESLIESRLDYSKPLKEVAQQAFDMRNSIRTQARNAMNNTAWAQHLFNSQKNVTFEQLVKKYTKQGYVGAQLWQKIIAASMRSRSKIDMLFGLN